MSPVVDPKPGEGDPPKKPATKTKVRIEPRDPPPAFTLPPAPTSEEAGGGPTSSPTLPPAPDPTAGTPAPTALPAEEERDLRDLGWVPKDEFKGDAKNWKGPEDFRKDLGKNGAAITRLLKETRKEKEATAQQVAALTAAVQTLSAGQSEQQKAALKARTDALLAELTEATTTGDTERATEIGVELSKIGEEAARVPSSAPSAGQWHTDGGMAKGIDNWRSRNNWVNRDYDKTAYAETVGRQMAARADEFATEAEFFAELDRAVSAKFDKPGADPLPPSAGPGQRKAVTNRGTAVQDVTSIDDLPAEAKAVAKRQIRMLNLSEEAYLENYNQVRQSQINKGNL